MTMKYSLIKDIEVKYLLNHALTDDINSREIYIKSIEHIYYKGYTTFKTKKL